MNGRGSVMAGGWHCQAKLGSESQRRLRITGLMLLVGAGVGLLAPGCGPTTDLFDQQKPFPPPPAVFNDRDWATVLRENVKDGLVDYDHLSSHAGPLDSFLETVAAAGPLSTPGLFPSRHARLAYYLNAYNAAILKAALVAGVPTTLHDATKPRVEHDYRLRADRQLQVLADLRAAARRESEGDARVEFCLCNGAKGSPSLFARPFKAGMLEEQLRRVARDAMDNRDMVRVDHEQERLNVATVIHRNAGAFVHLYRRQTGARPGTLLNALLHMADGMRREWLNTAVGYRVGKIPFDRSLNRWTPADAGPRDGR